MSDLNTRFNTLMRKFQPKPRPELNLLVLGLNNAGKTTLTYRLISEPEDVLRSITPTLDIAHKHMKIKKMKLCVRDLSGQWRMRQTWHTFYPNTHALIYVIDSADVSRLSEARCELCDVLLDERMSHVPLLVLANKQDAAGALDSSTIADLLGLQRLEGRMWHILACSTLEDKGIDTILQWIYQTLKQYQPKGRLHKMLNHSILFGPTCSLEYRPR